MSEVMVVTRATPVPEVLPELLKWKVNVGDAQVLERCMMEALRLFPPLIMLLRQAKAPFAVTTSQGRSYVIPKVRSCSIRTFARTAALCQCVLETGHGPCFS